MERGLLFSLIFLITSSIYCSSSELDPSQLRILQSSFNVLAGIDPCTNQNLPSGISVVCNSDEPFRHLNVLIVSGVEGGSTGSSYNMLREIENMTKIETLVISNAKASGFLPDNWPTSLVFINLSSNSIRGTIPKSISSLPSLQFLDLSRNLLHDSIPDSFGDMVMLKNLSLASNLLSGKIPESMAAMKSLVHLDLSNNRLTGPIPDFFAQMKELKYLNLEGNLFEKELPFDKSFVARLQVFRIGGNQKLCYDSYKMSDVVHLAGLVDLGKVSPCYVPGPTSLVVGIGYVLLLVYVLVFILVIIAKFCK